MEQCLPTLEGGELSDRSRCEADEVKSSEQRNVISIYTD